MKYIVFTWFLGTLFTSGYAGAWINTRPIYASSFSGGTLLLTSAIVWPMMLGSEICHISGRCSDVTKTTREQSEQK